MLMKCRRKKFMRNYLKTIEIVGATMCYQEGEQCRWALDWLVANCDRVCVLLDNWDVNTEGIVLEYKEKYPGVVSVFYSDEPVREYKNEVQGQIKKRFKLRQNYIRERVIAALRKMHEEKAIDLLVWPDSDETFTEDFPNYLEKFWEQKNHNFMVLGFLEPFESFRIIMSHRMAPHGRVYKYNPLMTAQPYQTRTVYHPYENGHPWKVRNLVLHMCHFKDRDRARRQFFDNRDWYTECPRWLWLLPKDVRKMTVEEIADYQNGYHGVPAKYDPIPLEEFLNNKSKYEEYVYYGQ